MTGTAATQAAEFRELYGLDVAAIAPQPSSGRGSITRTAGSRTRAEKEDAVLDEIRRRASGRQPVLVGTSSVEESERLSARLRDVPHQVLNARNEEAEAAIVARAGEAGAVTISTNMAGRGVDIRLGAGVADLGGLHVIGTNRHESRRIDHNCAARAGRQGDPGSSQFFVSLQDPLMVSTPIGRDADLVIVRRIQRVAEGQSFGLPSLPPEVRIRQSRGSDCSSPSAASAVLAGLGSTSASEVERLVTLDTIDDLWSDYLAAVSELRASTIWVSLGGGSPFREYVFRLHAMFQECTAWLESEVRSRLERAATVGVEPRQRGATWTYLTTDEPFGTMTDRLMRGLARMLRGTRRS